MVINDNEKSLIYYFFGKNGDFYTSLKWLVNASNKVVNVSKI
jgi:hypothetical protein